MTAHPKSTDSDGIHGGVSGTQTSLNRLRMRQETLRRQAAQLQARAEHLQREHEASSQRLSRRIDAHEKIVLGSLVKKAGLDFTRPTDCTMSTIGSQVQNTTSASKAGASMPKHLDDLAADYDRELILGALLWLASAMREADEKAVAGMTLQRLREDGRRMLGSARRH